MNYGNTIQTTHITKHNREVLKIHTITVRESVGERAKARERERERERAKGKERARAREREQARESSQKKGKLTIVYS